MNIEPKYAAINAVSGIAEPWIELWSGDEWGESMQSLHGACHTSYGFSDEDCALFASRLWVNLMEQYEWVITEGKSYGFWDPDNVKRTQERCRELRDYWLAGGNLKDDASRAEAKAVIEQMPEWVFG